MTEILQLTVSGMTCGGCENAVRQTLRQLDGVEDVKASHEQNLVGVTFDPDKVEASTLRERIASLGYSVAP
jgi:copper chaperone CopZ